MRGRSVKITRDTVTYLIGAIGTVYVTVFMEGSAGERLPFLVIFAGIITAPAFLHRDEKARDAPPKEKEELRE